MIAYDIRFESIKELHVMSFKDAMTTKDRQMDGSGLKTCQNEAKKRLDNSRKRPVKLQRQ
jgi:hypothetical protein